MFTLCKSLFNLMLILCTSNLVALCDTRGDFNEFSVSNNTASLKGWVASHETTPITGFRVQFPNREVTVECSPIQQMSGFSFTIPLIDAEKQQLQNHLIKLTPLLSDQLGQPLYQHYKPQIPKPTQEETNAVGGGDFQSIGLHFLGIFEGRGGLQKDHHVLDIGCGLGRMAYPMTYFLDSTTAYEGFDIEKNLVQKAKMLIEPHASNFHFQFVDVYNGYYNPQGKLRSHTFTFPYEDDAFDFAFLTSVFTHMLSQDIIHYLAEIKRVLKPDGKCLLTCFLLDAESRTLLAQHKSHLGFYHTHGDCMVNNPASPEAAVAYDIDLFLSWINQLGFQVNTIHKGSWSGRANFVSFQDIIVIQKP